MCWSSLSPLIEGVWYKMGGGGIATNPMNEYLMFLGGNKPTGAIIDFLYRDSSNLIKKWDKLKIEDIIPISTSLLSAALKKLTTSPFRGSQYRLELILCSLRTERHICLIRNEENRTCENCGKADSFIRVLLFCTHAQVAWCVLSNTVKNEYGIELKIIPSTVLLGTLAGITNCKQHNKM